MIFRDGATHRRPVHLAGRRVNNEADVLFACGLEYVQCSVYVRPYVGRWRFVRVRNANQRGEMKHDVNAPNGARDTVMIFYVPTQDVDLAAMWRRVEPTRSSAGAVSHQCPN